MIHYELPRDWIRYDLQGILPEFAAAKAAMLSLTSIPYQRSWADQLQQIQLKREVAGTSRIEGAEFTEKELEAAMRDTPGQLATRSQRQAAAAVATYRWLGKLRERGENVNFGVPRHRGAEGGEECRTALESLCRAAQSVYRGHDPLLQALALHYHFAAMHPFLDGNGRTARALEALMLQRTGLRDTLFIAMSNYYYEEKNAYLATLAEARAAGHDLTPFFKFGLKGVESQCRRLFAEIRTQLAKALFRNVMFDLFHRLKTPRKRVVGERQVEILKLLLHDEALLLAGLQKRTEHLYRVANPYKALIRDLNALIRLGAITFEKLEQGQFRLKINLEWPTQITETDFFQKVKEMPKAKTHSFLS
jgi:Fic family protein